MARPSNRLETSWTARSSLRHVRDRAEIQSYMPGPKYVEDREETRRFHLGAVRSLSTDPLESHQSNWPVRVRVGKPRTL